MTFSTGPAPANTPNVIVVIDEGMIQSETHSGLPEKLRALGYGVEVTTFIAKGENRAVTAYGPDQCVVAYGSIEFVEQRVQAIQGIPGCYYARDRLMCSHYMPRIPLELLGNADAVYLPFAEFERRLDQLYRYFGASRLFVRPDSGIKTFAGLCIDRESAAFELSSLKQLTPVTEKSLVLVAPASVIAAEYRFFIVDGKVITGSRYHVGGKISIHPSISQACLRVAEQVAALPRQIDLAYVCDVGFFDGVPKVVELNGFSTSGLYACNSMELFKAVADLAWREFNYEVAMED